MDSTPLTRFREDYWGYYNGTQNYTMIPKQFVPMYIPQETRTSGGINVLVHSSSSGNRNPDSTYAKAAMLKEVVYPTGGKTVFDFEPNRAPNTYSYPAGFAVPEIVGGFRIRAIKNYLEDGTLANYKYYTYGPGITQIIWEDLFSQVQRNVILTDDWISTGGAVISYPSTIISSTPFLPLTCDNGPPVFYGTVVEYVGGKNVNAGKTVYQYETPPIIANPNSGYDAPIFQGTFFFDQGNYIARLSSKKSYKRNNNGSYTPLHESLTSYGNYLTTTYHMGMKTTQLSSYPGNHYGEDYASPMGTWGLNRSLHYLPDGRDGGQGAPFYMIAVDVKGTQDLRLPTQNTERTYDRTRPVPSLIRYRQA